MQLKPVKKTKQPKYPVLEYYAEHPQLLNKSVPKNWLKSKVVALSLASFVLCGYESKNNQDIQLNDTTSVSDTLLDGGSEIFACVAIAPAVHISEENAKRLIVEELKKHGLEFNRYYGLQIHCKELTVEDMFGSDKEYERIKSAILEIEDLEWNKDHYIDTLQQEEFARQIVIKRQNIRCLLKKVAKSKIDTIILDRKKIPIDIDRYNKDLNLGIIYLSQRDFESLALDPIYFLAGFENKILEYIKNNIESHKLKKLGIFYDPSLFCEIANYKSTIFESFESAKGKNYKIWLQKKCSCDGSNIYFSNDYTSFAEKQLKKQVEDFVKWLKKEKIIEAE